MKMPSCTKPMSCGTENSNKNVLIEQSETNF